MEACEWSCIFCAIRPCFVSCFHLIHRHLMVNFNLNCWCNIWVCVRWLMNAGDALNEIGRLEYMEKPPECGGIWKKTSECASNNRKLWFAWDSLDRINALKWFCYIFHRTQIQSRNGCQHRKDSAIAEALIPRIISEKIPIAVCQSPKYYRISKSISVVWP